jgi:PAS domain S-box-containing protein
VLNDEQDAIEHAVAKEGYVHPKPRLDNPHGITRAVIEEAKLVAIPDITKDPRVNPELLREYRSMFAVPLADKGKVVGVLYLNGRTTKVLTETEQSLLYTLGDQAANFILRTRLDERLAESEAMYHSLLDNIPQCIFRKDENSRFVSANAAFCRSLNKRWEEISGRNDHDFYDKAIALAYINDDQTVMQTKKTLAKDEQHWIKGADKPIWVHVVKTPVLDTSGNVTGVQAIFWDVTEQRNAEKKRREAEQRWRSLVEQSPDSIVVHSGGEIRLANPAAMTLFGVESMEELAGRHITDFIEPSFHEAVASRRDRLMKGEPVEQGAAMKVLKKNRETVDVEVYASAGPGKNEVQVVFHDLTGKQVLLREMHHRVRRSMNKIQGLLGFHEELANDSQVRRIFQVVRHQIQAMALVHTILKDTAREYDVDMKEYLTQLVEAVFKAYKSPKTTFWH